jgi:hypothetical protein
VFRVYFQAKDDLDDVMRQLELSTAALFAAEAKLDSNVSSRPNPGERCCALYEALFLQPYTQYEHKPSKINQSTQEVQKRVLILLSKQLPLCFHRWPAGDSCYEGR